MFQLFGVLLFMCQVGKTKPYCRLLIMICVGASSSAQTMLQIFKLVLTSINKTIIKSLAK